MAAASPPVKLVISAFLVSAMLTMIEPENTGPITTYAFSSTAFCVSAFASCGCDCVSEDEYSTLRPRMPPAALISLTASLTPLSKFVPAVAPPPDNSTTPAILIGGCCAATSSGAHARVPTINHCLHERFIHSSVSLFEYCEIKDYVFFSNPPLPATTAKSSRERYRESIDQVSRLGPHATPPDESFRCLLDQHPDAIGDNAGTGVPRVAQKWRQPFAVNEIVGEAPLTEGGPWHRRQFAV